MKLNIKILNKNISKVLEISSEIVYNIMVGLLFY